MTKRLFVATGIFHPESGGPATYLHQVLPVLQNKGWDVQLLTYGEGDTASYPYPVQRVGRVALPARYARYAWHSLNARHADLVYFHTTDLPIIPHNAPRVMKVVGDPAWERCIRKGWIAPDTDIDRFQASPSQGVVAQQKRSRNAQVGEMDGIIVPSDYLKQMVMGWGVPEERITVIYNALPPITGERLTQAEARQRLNLDPNAPIIVTAARLTAWKGVDHLMTALQGLPNVQLMIAGDGDDVHRLKTIASKTIQQRAHFLGQLDRQTLYHYMQAADYFALYSGYEGLSHTLLESLRVGTPLIASAKGGNLEVVREDVNGFLVPHVDVDALRDTLIRALDSATRQRLSENTALGMERFTFDHMTEQTHQTLVRYAR